MWLPAKAFSPTERSVEGSLTSEMFAFSKALAPIVWTRYLSRGR